MHIEHCQKWTGGHMGQSELNTRGGRWSACGGVALAVAPSQDACVEIVAARERPSLAGRLFAHLYVCRRCLSAPRRSLWCSWRWGWACNNICGNTSLRCPSTVLQEYRSNPARIFSVDDTPKGLLDYWSVLLIISEGAMKTWQCFWSTDIQSSLQEWCFESASVDEIL